jgi:hypothetical protein
VQAIDAGATANRVTNIATANDIITTKTLNYVIAA